LSEIREARLQKANSLVSKGFASYAESFKICFVKSDNVLNFY